MCDWCLLYSCAYRLKRGLYLEIHTMALTWCSMVMYGLAVMFSSIIWVQILLMIISLLWTKTPYGHLQNQSTNVMLISSIFGIRYLVCAISVMLMLWIKCLIMSSPVTTNEHMWRTDNGNKPYCLLKLMFLTKEV